MPKHSEDLHRKALLFWEKKGEALFIAKAGLDTSSSKLGTSPSKRSALRQDFLKALDRIRGDGRNDPFSNSISLLALDILQRLHGESLNHEDINILTQQLCLSTFAFRAQRMGSYLGTIDPDVNDRRIRDILRQIAMPDKKPIPFDRFRQIVEREFFGVVFTAHPTFSLHHDLMHALCRLAMGHAGADTGKEAEDLALVSHTLHLPERPITLEDEHRLASEAITHAHAALRRLFGIVFSIARELYPKQASTLMPRLVSLASWVGYDIDGRDDITWIDTLHKRLQVQFYQLGHYRHCVNDVIALNPGKSTNAPLRTTLNLLHEKLESMNQSVGEEIHVFDECRNQSDPHQAIASIARSMHHGREQRLTRSEELIALINQAIHQCLDNPIGEKRIHSLCILRAEIGHYGLATAHTHVRINASQLHNAIRNDIDMQGDPSDPSRQRIYIRHLNDLLDHIKPVTINFGSLLNERMSAKRLFMIVRQMLTYMDATTCVRFLIAECDTALSALSALYFARLFGVDDRIDISPLFETERALRKGPLIIDELLSNPHWKRYIMQRQKLCVQTGFSDSGRYIGQVAAALAIENLHIGIVHVLEKHDLGDIDVVMFNTHGESIGRGAHPENMHARLHYLSSNYVRQSFKNTDLVLKEEISFQGGDGYVWFMDDDSAFAVITRIIEHRLDPNLRDDQQDPFYDHPDHGAELADGVKHFNQLIMDDPCYHTLLGLFSTHTLHPTGSRPTQRRDENISGDKIPPHPSQMRAIPQNAILQQLGFLANSLGGVGRYFEADREKFTDMYRNSQRFRRIVSIAEYAFAFSDFEILKANTALFDPGNWLSCATRSDDPSVRDDMKELARILAQLPIHGQISAVADTFQREYLSVREWLLGSGQQVALAVGKGRVIRKEYRDDLLLLHALKIALIREIFLLAMRIPPFSYQKGHSRDDIVIRILHLDIEPSLAFLRNIFPARPRTKTTTDFGEKATYRDGQISDYTRYHRDIFDPIEKLYATIRRLSHGIVDFIGAVG